jgi:hypothetical protein
MIKLGSWRTDEKIRRKEEQKIRKSAALDERFTCRAFHLPSAALEAKKISGSEGTLLKRSGPKAKRSFSSATRNSQPATHTRHSS